MVHVTALAIVQNAWRRMIGRLVNNILKRRGGGSNRGQISGIIPKFSGETGKITRNLSQNSRSQD